MWLQSPCIWSMPHGLQSIQIINLKLSRSLVTNTSSNNLGFLESNLSTVTNASLWQHEPIYCKLKNGLMSTCNHWFANQSHWALIHWHHSFCINSTKLCIWHPVKHILKSNSLLHIHVCHDTKPTVRKCQATILDYDLDQSDYWPLATNNAPSITSNASNLPSVTTNHGYATELQLLKHEISQLTMLITTAMEQIKQALASLPTISPSQNKLQ